jgi:hypothetical protein
MKETAIIEFDANDRDILFAIFERFKVALISKTDASPSKEDEAIRRRLHDKYVVTGLWENMNLEEREDAAHAESMIYAQEQPDYVVYSPEQTKDHLTKLRQKLTNANAGHK